MLKAGLIGYGYWGPNLARNLADADDQVRLTTIADARPGRRQAAERRHPGVNACADAMDVIDSGNVDASTACRVLGNISSSLDKGEPASRRLCCGANCASGRTRNEWPLPCFACHRR